MKSGVHLHTTRQATEECHLLSIDDNAVAAMGVSARTLKQKLQSFLSYSWTLCSNFNMKHQALSYASALSVTAADALMAAQSVKDPGCSACYEPPGAGPPCFLSALSFLWWLAMAALC